MSSPQVKPFQERLGALFERGLPDGTRATPSEVARRAQAAGFQLSRPYVGQLRSGRAQNPALSTIQALASVFQVEPNYFFGRPESAGDAYEVAATAADDPEAIIGAAGGDLDEEEKKQLGVFLKFLRSEQRAKDA